MLKYVLTVKLSKTQHDTIPRKTAAIETEALVNHANRISRNTEPALQTVRSVLENFGYVVDIDISEF